MFYLIGHIWLCLLIAALIGAIIGWLLRNLRAQQEIDEVTRNAAEERHRLEGDLATSRRSLLDAEQQAKSDHAGLEKLRLELDASRDAVSAAETTAKGFSSQLDESRGELEKLTVALDASKAAVTAADERSEGLSSQLEETKADLEQLGTALGIAKASSAAAEKSSKTYSTQLDESRSAFAKLESQAAAGDADRLAVLTRMEADLAACQAAARSTDEAHQRELDDLRTQLQDCRDAKAKLEDTSAAPTGAAALGLMAGAAFSSTSSSAPLKPDDLKRVEGIGPKIESLLNDQGIHTWAALSTAKIAHLQSILDAAGPRYRIHNPSTWPHQAKLAAEGKWDELEELQDRLKGGREA